MELTNILIRYSTAHRKGTALHTPGWPDNSHSCTALQTPQHWHTPLATVWSSPLPPPQFTPECRVDDAVEISSLTKRSMHTPALIKLTSAMAGGIQPFANNQANLNPEDAANLRWSWRAAAAGPGSLAGPCWPGQHQQWPPTHWVSSQMTPAHHQGSLGSGEINPPGKVKKKKKKMAHKAPWDRFQLNSSSHSSVWQSHGTLEHCSSLHL